MFGFVYIWYDRKNKKFYIGSHKGHLDDRYICSSTWMRNSYFRRPNDFKRRILKKIFEEDKTILLNEEQKWLDLIKDHELGKKYYNLKKKAYGGFTKEAILKSISLRKGKPISPECKLKQSLALKNKPWSDKRRKAEKGSYTKRLIYEHNGVIIGNVEHAIQYSKKVKSTINRWCDQRKNGWRKYYVT